MKRLLYSIIFVGSVANLSSQVISSKKWTDLFSYNNVFSISEDSEKLVAATENGLFYYNMNSGEITKLSKANGLHEVKITAFDFNPQTKTGLIGYASGAMDVITPNGITYIVDIPIAQSFTGDKRVNHISINGNLAVISMNYGVSLFNLSKKEFEDSSFFGNSGSFEAANEAAIKDNKVFVATNSGLFSHVMDVTFPVFTTWNTEMTGSFTDLDYDTELVASTETQLFLNNNGSFTPVSQAFTQINDVVINGNNIIVTDNRVVYQFDLSGNIVNTFNFGADCNTANLISGQAFAGSTEQGIINTDGNSLKPDGPYNNTSYKIAKLGDQIWVASGGLVNFAGTTSRDLGYYHFNGQQWYYPDYFIDNPIRFNITDVMPNPSNPAEVFFTNYVYDTGDQGIYRMENNTYVKSYKKNDIDPLYNRPIGIGFDENNNLFVSVFLFKGQSQNSGYYYYDRSADDFTTVPITTKYGAMRPVLKDGFILIPQPYFTDGGLIMKKYGENPTNINAPQKILSNDNNLPAGAVSIAIDKKDDLWIGTRSGLRILPDFESSFDDLVPQTENIVIEQNGIPEELFRDSVILQIAADSGNHKWVSVDGGGVYYLSENGEQTLQHFTKENSPLPTNSATDILVDEKTGQVYFVTLDGIVVYQGDVADVSSAFGNVVVYPNPVVRNNFRGNVTIKGLADKTNIRITDAAGNLVHQAVARGGFYQWDLNNQRGNRVASGVYFVLMTNGDGTDKATAKIAVVN